MATFIVQVKVKKQIGKSGIFGAEVLKIHPVEANTEEDSISLLREYYSAFKPGYKVTIVDSEAPITFALVEMKKNLLEIEKEKQ